MEPTDDRIDIRDPLLEICERFGLEYDCVAEITWRPLDAEAKVYLKDEHGMKFISEDGNPAMETLFFKVRT